MTKGGAIIGLADWLETPAGRYLLQWEQQQIEAVVADVFGFHALQLGMPQLDGLAANRMPHRWLATERWLAAATDEAAIGAPVAPAGRVASLACEFDALPFDSQSLDLVVLPHALELARDPHLALSEVERVLMPEGKVVITGFNPTSLWGLRQGAGHAVQRLGWRREPGLFLPKAGEFIAYRRLRDWLRLLSFEVEAGRFGCYRPPLRSAQWLGRFEWMDAVGDRWWPVLGGVYLLVAVKRVRGMRLVGLARADSRRSKAARAVAVQQQQDPA
jgi:SAM-dependent methyltransferase